MLIAGNWKMFRGPDPAALAGLDAVVCPPFTRLRECVEAGLTTYAQNVHWEKEGAYTGEISVPLLLEVGALGLGCHRCGASSVLSQLSGPGRTPASRAAARPRLAVPQCSLLSGTTGSTMRPKVELVTAAKEQYQATAAVASPAQPPAFTMSL